MATRAYDRSLEESERQRMEELGRYGTSSYGYGDPALGRQQQQLWNQPIAGGYAQPFQQQLNPFNTLAQQIPFGLQNPFFGVAPWAGLGSGYGQQFGTSSPVMGQYGGGFIDPLQLRQLQLWNLALGYGQTSPLSQGFFDPFSLYQQGLQQFGLPLGQRLGFGGGRQAEFGRGWGIPRITRRAPKGYKRPDEFIRDDISERLAHHPYLDATNCEVIVKDGEVTIRGTVDDRVSKNILEEIAETVFGVKDVLVEVRVGQPIEREQEMTGAAKGREK